VSKTSLDIQTDIITAVRSSDSEKCFANNNSDKGFNENKENQIKEEKFKKRKQSDLIL
jgi:hypothetical protein